MSADGIWEQRHEPKKHADELIRFDIPMPEGWKGINPDGVYDLNLNTCESTTRYERRGDDRVMFLRFTERDRLLNVIRDEEIETGTMVGFYWKPKPSFFSRVLIAVGSS